MPRPPNIPKRNLLNQFKLAPQHRVAPLIEQGFALLGEGKFNEAQNIYEQVLAIQPNHFDALQLLGALSVQTKQFTKAVNLLTKALKINPNHAACYSNRGIALKELGRFEEALISYEKAIRLAPDFVKTYFNRGNALQELGRFEEALVSYDKAISIAPDYAEAHSNRGNVLKELGRFEESLISCDKAISITHDYVEAHSNRGTALKELKRFEEALISYEKAISIAPDYAELYSNSGITLQELKRYNEAITHFDKALTLKPEYAEAWSNKGTTLHKLKRFHEAIAHHDKALILKPEYAEAWSNKGAILNELKRYDEAIAHSNRALSLKPDYAEALTNKGVCLGELKRYDEAIVHYDKALSLKPDMDWLLGDFLHTKMKMGSWDHLQDKVNHLTDKLLVHEKVSAPFQILSIVDDLSLHQQCAQIFAQDKYPVNPVLGPIAKRQKNQKIRIGYFSADFKEHPIAYLTAELFELHNKNQFECIGFSFSAEDQSAIRQRLSSAFNQLIDVSDMPDEQIAQLSRDMGIDIAVNLGGYTTDNRIGAFACRAAPIQVNYLGVSTMGASYYDYIVSDKVAIPESSQAFYTEKVAYLPHSCMLDDSHRVASTRIFSKQECGLPEDAFIFCCFNNDYKFNEAVLESWSKILLSVHHSILWLPENHETFRINIIAQFEKRGIESNRVIFAKRVDLMADHLARCALADLFLDTHLYNAHTTALDFLKSGVPVLTRPSQALVGRIAASLLNAIGLEEMITSTQEEYEALAIQLATEPEKFAALKQKLRDNIKTAPLFDTPQYTKDLEAIYIQMYERYQHDLEPESIAIA